MKKTPQDRLQEMKRQLQTCQSCPLHNNSGKVVPGIGSINPDVLFIGEGPGATEAERGLPFVGQAGQLFQSILRNHSIKMNQIYVTNIVKHRPPNNRKPTESEQYTCGSNYLIQEIDLVRPKVIVALGRTACEGLYLVEDQHLPRGSLRGHRWIYKDYPAIATWHPAYILRNQDKYNELEEDILAAFKLANTIQSGAQDEILL